MPTHSPVPSDRAVTPAPPLGRGLSRLLSCTGHHQALAYRGTADETVQPLLFPLTLQHAPKFLPHNRSTAQDSSDSQICYVESLKSRQQSTPVPLVPRLGAVEL